MSGNLKLSLIKIFRDEYAEEIGLRNDPDEFLSASFKAGDNIKIFLEHEGQRIGESSAIKERISSLDHRSYLFSMSAITEKSFSQDHAWCFDSREAILFLRAGNC